MAEIHQDQIFFTLRQNRKYEKLEESSQGWRFLVNNPSLQNSHKQNLSSQFHQNPDIYYYNMLFSPKQMAQSIKRRNDNLQMLDFQNSGQEPDDVFNRRKQKVADLLSKQQEQLSLLQKIKKQDQNKYAAMMAFIKYFCRLKEKILGTRTDYYSNKTFCSLKNASQQELTSVVKALQKMYNNIIKQTKFLQAETKSTIQHKTLMDQRIYEFLIIPRFLISRQKINRLSKDQVLQQNLEFLISHKCLGHYNNQANKKMPQEAQMVYIRQLITKKFGKQKFKKISSINHGNKFLKNYKNIYYQLYSKSLQYLRQLDYHIKKGKKYESIKKQLDKIPQDDDEKMGSFKSESDYSYSNPNSNSNSNSNSNTYSNSISKSNSNSNNAFDLQNIAQLVVKMENNLEQSFEMLSELRDEPIQIDSHIYKNFKAKKLNSTPAFEIEIKSEKKPRSFAVKKSRTMQPMYGRTTQNIILIAPPQLNNQES